MPDVSQTERRYDGEENAVIAFATDVWLRDATGADINLTEARESGKYELVQHRVCEAWDLVDGAISPINDDYGIERCDECEVFEGDFEAARAVAAVLGPDLTIWYHPSPKEN